MQRISRDEVFTTAHALWPNTKVADIIAKDAVGIILNAHSRKSYFFSGKSSKSIVAGLFYLLSYRYDVIKNQREIGDKLDTTDNSIRDSYREWLETFPDIFKDTFVKMMKNPDLRIPSEILIKFQHA